MQWWRAARWPPAGDAAAGQILIERLAGTYLLADPDIDRMLRGVGGHTPYLADLIARSPDVAAAILWDGPQRIVDAALARLRDLAPDAGRGVVARTARMAKNNVALAVALADIGGLWRLADITAALSDLAEAALRAVVDHLLHAAREAGSLAAIDPARSGASGFVVLAMGKLGGRELNYSSDVDLILLHDPQAARGREGSALFSRLARDIVALMESRDQDGYVFRTDLRLRPDPAATPPSVAVAAALTYYEAAAQTWERAAMIRARPVAGDLELGLHFLEAIRPFVWRRSLDFSAVADLHAMKQRDRCAQGVSGDDRAGRPRRQAGSRRHPRDRVHRADSATDLGRSRARLRQRDTVAVLRCLARAGHLRPRVAGELIAAYRVLRARRAPLADGRRPADPHAAANRRTGRVRGVFRLHRSGRVRGAARAPPAPGGGALRRCLRRWRRAGRASRHDGARRIGLCRAGCDPRPADRLARGAAARPAQPARSRLVGRHAARPSARARSAAAAGRGVRAMGSLSGPAAGGHRAAVAVRSQPRAAGPAGRGPGCRRPAGRASGQYALGHRGSGWRRPDHRTRPSCLGGRLADVAETTSGLDEAIRIVQRTVREEDFAISLATLEGRIDADLAGLRRTALADAAIGAMLPLVLADLRRRHGVVPGGEVAVVLLGKAGGGR